MSSIYSRKLSLEEFEELVESLRDVRDALELKMRTEHLTLSQSDSLGLAKSFLKDRQSVVHETLLLSQSDLMALSTIYRTMTTSRLLFARRPKVLGDLADEFSEDKIYESIEHEIAGKIKTLRSEGKKLNIVFMFGSGASRSDPSNIPTVNEMLNYLVSKFPPEIPFAGKVKEWAARGDVNIEDILTAGYLSTLLISKPVVNKLIGEIIYRESREQVAELREREYVFSFQDLTNRVFSMVSGLMAQAQSNVVHDSVAKLISNWKDDDLLEFAITTTNYDVCIEKAFRKHNLPYTYLGIESTIGVPIVKIHGSVNWFYCEGCQSVITYSVKELEVFKKIFPTSGSCQKCGTPTSLLMVPPIAYKYVIYPPLIDIWQAAMRTIERANLIIVIGYSFGLADDYFFKMMVTGMKKNKSTLVMLDNNPNSISNLENKLTTYHLKPPFPVYGDATETVPRILKVIGTARNKASKKVAKNKMT